MVKVEDEGMVIVVVVVGVGEKKGRGPQAEEGTYCKYWVCLRSCVVVTPRFALCNGEWRQERKKN